MGLIREILEICDNINYQYENSKFPKFIKKYIYKNNIKRIEDIIDKLEDKINANHVSEYIRLLAEHYPPDGVFEHCKSVKNLGVSFAATFEFDMLKTNNDKYVVAADVYDISNGAFEKSCNTKIAIFHHDIQQMSFECALDNLTPITEGSTNRAETLAYTSRIKLQTIIKQDTIQFLKNYIEECRGKIDARERVHRSRINK